jgi:hypothetical protein
MQLSDFQLPIHSSAPIKMIAVKRLDSIGVTHIKGESRDSVPTLCAKEETQHAQLAFRRLPPHVNLPFCWQGSPVRSSPFSGSSIGCDWHACAGTVR